MILSSTSPYGLLKEFSIACGVSYNAIFHCTRAECDQMSKTFCNCLPKLLKI